ncbi:MAG: FHA domain-containing protein [Sulfuritalea sp.]|nr:FHA domain-containing protein [Sulfuritalea sp.]
MNHASIEIWALLTVGGLALLAVGVVAVFVRHRRREAAANGGGLNKPASSPNPGAADSVAPYDPNATRIFRHTAGPSRSAPAPAPTAGVPGGYLIGLSGTQRGKRFRVTEPYIMVGRSPSCDIVLDDLRVSSRHAWIGSVGGQVVLRDLKSTNGTFLNAQTKDSIAEVQLRSGDTIFFGGHLCEQFRFVAD